MPAILPTWASAPLAVTSMVPLPWVTGVFMNAMFFWSPGPTSASASAPDSFDAGVLSPVSADSSMLSALAWMIRPSAATLSPAVISTTSPRTTSSTGITDSTPSRRTRAVCFVNDFSAFIALSALPSCRRPTTALQHRQQQQHGARAPLTDGERQDTGDEQDDLHVGGVLIEEASPARHTLLGRKCVGSIRLQSLGGLRRGEAAGGVDAESLGDVVG